MRGARRSVADKTFRAKKVIYFQRTASIAAGKAVTAMSFAREVAWYVQYESLAALEDTQAKLLADQKYMELIGKSAENFIAGSVHDDIWRLL